MGFPGLEGTHERVNVASRLERVDRHAQAPGRIVWQFTCGHAETVGGLGIEVRGRHRPARMCERQVDAQFVHRAVHHFYAQVGRRDVAAPFALDVRVEGRVLVVVSCEAEGAEAAIRALSPERLERESLPLEEILVAQLRGGRAEATAQPVEEVLHG